MKPRTQTEGTTHAEDKMRTEGATHAEAALRTEGALRAEGATHAPEAQRESDLAGDANVDRHDVVLDVAVALLLFALAAIPRLAGLDVFLTPDETRWTCRSTNFYASLAVGDLAATYQKEHPGVMTMWLGNLGRAVDPTDDVATACRTVPASKLVTETSHETLERIAARLFSGRIRVALLTALGVACVYLMGLRLFGRSAAFLGALLIAWDPLFLAQSRVLHLDAVTTTFVTLSLLALCVYVFRHGSIRWVVAAGILGGLAALNKSPAMFLAPFVALVAIGGSRHRDDRWRWMARVVVVWGLSAAVAYVVMWPAMWVAPIESVTGVLRGAVGYADDPHEGSNYFWGAIRPDPGPFFYPVSWLFRATPLALIGLVVALVRLSRRRGDRAERGTAWTLLVFALLFTLFMTTGAKKFDRYLLPVYPALLLVASVGLAAIVRWCAVAAGARRPASRAARWAWPAALTAIVLLQASFVVRHHPYYLSYYNPVLGGARSAQWAMLVGWGEGLEQAVAHMNARVDAAELAVATRYRSAVGPILAGRALEMDDYDPASLDYYLLYLNQIQRDLDPPLIDRLYGIAEPELVARFRGIDYAWLYPNLNYEPVLERIDARASAGDAIVVRADSQLAKHYDGSLPLLTFDPDASRDTILANLEEALAAHDRLWYVRYDDVQPRPGLAAADFALATRVYAVSEMAFPEVSLRLLATNGAVDLTDPLPIDVEQLGASFGDEIALSGYGLTGAPIEWGRDLGVHLDWQSVGDIERDLTAFVHLIGADGERWAQVDQRITDPDLVPTSQWPADAATRAVYHLGIPPGTPVGTYELHVGVYDSATGDRLPTVVDGVRADDDVVRIGVDVATSPFEAAAEDLGLVETVNHRYRGMDLLGYGLGGPVEGGSVATIHVFRRLDAPIEPEWGERLTIVDLTGAVVGEVEAPPRRWNGPGLARLTHAVPVDGRARAGSGTLIYALTDGQGALLDEDGSSVEMPIEITGPVRAFEVTDQLGTEVGADLGGLVSLVGYEFGADRAAPGATLPVTLTWRAESLIDVPYTVFLHLLDADGVLLTQIDAQPLGGTRPTTSWLPGEVVADPYLLTIPADAPAGRYRLGTGMYDPQTVTPLAATDRDGLRLPDDRVMLGSIEIQ